MKLSEYPLVKVRLGHTRVRSANGVGGLILSTIKYIDGTDVFFVLCQTGIALILFRDECTNVEVEDVQN